MQGGLAVHEHKVAMIQVAANFPIESARILALELLGKRRAKLLPLLRKVNLIAFFIDHIICARPDVGAIEHSMPQAAHVVLVDWLGPRKAFGKDLWYAN